MVLRFAIWKNDVQRVVLGVMTVHKALLPTSSDIPFPNALYRQLAFSNATGSQHLCAIVAAPDYLVRVNMRKRLLNLSARDAAHLMRSIS